MLSHGGNQLNKHTHKYPQNGYVPCISSYSLAFGSKTRRSHSLPARVCIYLALVAIFRAISAIDLSSSRWIVKIFQLENIITAKCKLCIGLAAGWHFHVPNNCQGVTFLVLLQRFCGLYIASVMIFYYHGSNVLVLYDFVIKIKAGRETEGQAQMNLCLSFYFLLCLSKSAL